MLWMWDIGGRKEMKRCPKCNGKMEQTIFNLNTCELVWICPKCIRPIRDFFTRAGEKRKQILREGNLEDLMNHDVKVFNTILNDDVTFPKVQKDN